ncbi:lasso peptide biosynthesis PqqD family chaperone [Clostridium pasteurianum]|uniref:lasso peptide biosynthesis PqqD family chaperone n=1 Tax=Clostridium pasteurianum TaxID=1501 RepID=UPI0022608566|nr:lasso peptide biosynthesis PqqD family chaperone [Clostridium pasteurianum]UZW14951.1 lasso peptide biosynthesis PqqD family chaperone [Clostridium pasteurianum]
MSKVNLIEISSIVSQKRGLDTTDLDGESVMMDIDKGRYYNFNSVASRIWELIEKPISIEEIVTQLLKEFDVDEKKCEAAVINFLNRLNDNELITVA